MQCSTIEYMQYLRLFGDYFTIFIAGHAPKTFLINNSSDYFFPSIQVESSDPEKLDQVTEIYIKSNQCYHDCHNTLTVIIITLFIWFPRLAGWWRDDDDTPPMFVYAEQVEPPQVGELLINEMTWLFETVAWLKPINWMVKWNYWQVERPTLIDLTNDRLFHWSEILCFSLWRVGLNSRTLEHLSCLVYNTPSLK